MNKLAAALTAITNASRLHKKSLIIKSSTPTLISFLSAMQKHGYLNSFTTLNDLRGTKIFIKLNGRLTKANAIVPRYNIKLNNGDVERYRENLLPARQFGHMMISSSKGLIDHEDALKMKVGGKIIGYFY